MRYILVLLLPCIIFAKSVVLIDFTSSSVEMSKIKILNEFFRLKLNENGMKNIKSLHLSLDYFVDRDTCIAKTKSLDPQIILSGKIDKIGDIYIFFFRAIFPKLKLKDFTINGKKKISEGDLPNIIEIAAQKMADRILSSQKSVKKGNFPKKVKIVKRVLSKGEKEVFSDKLREQFGIVKRSNWAFFLTASYPVGFMTGFEYFISDNFRLNFAFNYGFSKSIGISGDFVDEESFEDTDILLKKYPVTGGFDYRFYRNSILALNIFTGVEYAYEDKQEFKIFENNSLKRTDLFNISTYFVTLGVGAEKMLNKHIKINISTGYSFCLSKRNKNTDDSDLSVKINKKIESTDFSYPMIGLKLLYIF